MISEAVKLDPKGARLDTARNEIALPVPSYDVSVDFAGGLAFANVPGGTDFYPGPIIGAGALGRIIVEHDSTYIRKAVALLRRLSPDDYVNYLIMYFEAGLLRFGDRWGYADIVTVLIGLAEVIKPTHYLEIGVRRGRSVCAVASAAPACTMVLFDKWTPNYAGMENPGKDLVRGELLKIGHRGEATFIDGNSHITVPQYFRDYPQASFDIVTIDGDHSTLGAARDLADVLPRIKIGGAVVFDDIAHPKHPELRLVWRELVQNDPRFSCYNFISVGYGVGFAIRHQ